MNLQPSRLATLLVLLAVLLLPSFAGATTFVMVSDQDLADQAPIIVEVVVEAAEPSVVDGRPFTDYRISVERLLKGYLPASSVLVRVAGGTMPDGRELRLAGAPRLIPGGRALLFLTPGGDGTHTLVHFFLGAFHIVDGEDGELALRDLSGAEEIIPAGGERARREVRDLEGFSRWLEDRAVGVEAPREYLTEVSEAEISALSEAFTLVVQGGFEVRWRVFDSGGSATFQTHVSGQPGIADGGVGAFRTALGAWNADPASNVRLAYGGTTSATGGLGTDDGVSAILFDDPNNAEIFGGPFRCPGGGVLAAGGPWVSTSQHTFGGRTFRTIVRGDIVTNEGAGCYLSVSNRAQEVFAHELGHTLGLNHSCGDGTSGGCNTAAKNDALMRANPHGDGRGASLRSDDRAGICYLYGSVCVTAEPPTAPDQLSAQALDGTSIRLTWRDRADDESAQEVERRVGGGAFQRIATLGANQTDFVDAGLAAGVNYSFRVRALNAAGASGYSNIVSAQTVSAPPPTAPGNLRAVVVGPRSVRLSWQDRSNDETSFEIQFRLGGDFATLTVVDAGSEVFVPQALAPYSDYTFRVRALGAGSVSAFSNQATATTHPEDASTPLPPADALAVPLTDRRVLLRWRDRSDNELSFQLERRVGSAFQIVGEVPRNVTRFTVEGLTPGATYSFRIRAKGVSSFSPAAPLAMVRLPAAGQACVDAGPTACLLDRFNVEVRWRNQRNGDSGVAQSEVVSDRSGSFWFFSADNTELIVKVLDGRSVNGRFWVFFGALTDLQYWVTVADTQTGDMKTYQNAPGDICGRADTSGLEASPSVAEPASVASSFELRPIDEALVEALEQEAVHGAPGPEAGIRSTSAAMGACAPNSRTLCLLEGRFQVSVAWSRLDGSSGVGTAFPDTDRTGMFSFFNPNNIELVVKMLDGGGTNGNYWVFYGALSNVRYELEVVDTQTGERKTYVNVQGNVCGDADVKAFPSAS